MARNDRHLAVENLSLGFKTFEGEKRVLGIADLAVAKGETFGVVGESGSGKTVLALAVMGLLPKHTALFHSGRILLDGENLLEKTERELRAVRGRAMAMIFQDPMSSLNPVFTVGEQIKRVIKAHRPGPSRSIEAKARETLDLVKLPDAGRLMGKYPHELSGGQRQRVVIAIALSCGAELLIADEPTRNLDVTIQAGVLKLIDQLRKDLGITVLYIANNLGLVSALCDRVAVLKDGAIVESGSVRDVVRNSSNEYVRLLAASGAPGAAKAGGAA